MLPDPLLADLPRARRRWARTDPVLAGIAREFPPPPRAPEWRSYEGGFQALVGSIVHQQVSLAAGRTIFGRLEAACGGRIAPEAVLKLGPDALRAAGLSRAKAAYVGDLADRTLSGALDWGRIHEAPDAEVVATLTQVKGIGPWTAKMFLLFHLSRPDVSVPEDLGLVLAATKAYGVRRDRAARKLTQMAPAWSPFNSLAALTLWNWRRASGSGADA